MKTLIIHCGAHKTATSSLQLLFRQQSDWLLDRGIRYIQPEILNELRVPQHLRGETETVKNGQASGALENLKNELTSDTEAVLLSHESFFSHAGNPTKEPIYPSLPSALGRATSMFQDYRVRLIFCVREPASFAESLFLQNLGITFSGSFDDFFNHIDPLNLNWIPVAEQLCRTAGPSAVDIFPYEILSAQGPDHFLEYFLSLLGIEEKSPKKLPKTNQSFSQDASQALQEMGKSLLDLRPAERRLERKKLAEKFPTPQFERARLLRREQIETINSSLRCANEELFRNFMPGFNASLWSQPDI